MATVIDPLTDAIFELEGPIYKLQRLSTAIIVIGDAIGAEKEWRADAVHSAGETLKDLADDLLAKFQAVLTASR